MATTELDKPDIADPALEAENELSVTLFKYALWSGGGLFAVWIVAISLYL